MTDTEYIVLKKIFDMGTDVKMDNPSKDVSDALRTLVTRGYLEAYTCLVDNNLFNRYHVYSVTDLGCVALADAGQRKKRWRWENIRYWITTAIAVAALIVSIIALRSHTG